MVALRRAGRGGPPFYSQEDERGGPPGVLEEGLEGVLFPFLHMETVPLQLSTDPDQSAGLFSLSVDPATIYTEKDY